MNYQPLQPLAFLAAIPLVVAAQVYVLVRRMSKPEKMMQPLSGLTPDQEQLLTAFRDWLAARQFGYLTSFKFGAITTVAFQEQNTQRFFCFYFHQRVTFCMQSRFDDLALLETSNSGSLGMFPPRPNCYPQSLPGADADQLWQRHMEAESYLIQRFGIQWRPLSGSYQENVLTSMRASMAYVRSIPFYPFRALYWYAVSRRKLASQSIEQRYP